MKIRNLWEIEDRNWYNRVWFNVQNRNVLYLVILKIVNQNNNLLTTMIFDDPTTNYSRSVDDICIPIITRFDLLIFMFKDLNKFKHRIFRQNDAKNYHLTRNAKCRFCDFFGSQRTVQNNEVKAHRIDGWSWSIWVVEWRDSVAIHEPAIRNDSIRGRVRQLQVIHWRQEQTQADHVVLLSCARIPAIQTQLRVFHTPHESEEDLRPFMDYLTQLHQRVKELLFEELPLESTSKVEKDFRSTTVCPFCHKELEDDKVRHHAHVAGEYTTEKG